MRVDWKSPQDAMLIGELVRNTRQASQRDRYRVVLLAGCGDEWVGRYRRGGLDALKPIKNKGRSSKLTEQETAQLIETIERPPAEEHLAAYNGPIIKRKIEEHFGKIYALSGVYKMLHRLGYNDLMPRPSHPESDPQAQERFKKRVPRTARTDPAGSSRSAHPDLLPG